ncbi:hypothetical protein AB3R30_25450 [Leptolyngbyaceae cyanobacterium UHCC 1019]
MKSAAVVEYNPVVAAQNANVDSPWHWLFLEPSETIPHLPGSSESKVLLLYQWTIAHHWVIKLGWNPKHKPPFKTGAMNAGKPKGVFLHSVRGLCNFCFSETSPGSIAYDHPVYWMQDICRELLCSEYFDGANEPSKRELIRRKNEVWHQLKFNFQNPADPHRTYATWLLYEIALRMAEKSKGVRDNGSTPALFQQFWKAFLKSMKDEITALEKDAALFKIEHDKAFIQRKGRGMTFKPLTLKKMDRQNAH